ncbi:MAG: methyltransferase domain-containing protein [Microcystis novacekii Mn_MB_F_20050700_S1]|uniref:Methyltransferase domain-containing protein n=1 Tax=Microcystis novacekii Mn_MB_F_20050700_S1D TaxID=2486266 RepID=A0A552J7B4_9CHRO|nr:MAG: methyltransferase domain-containing protein [Microcystis novacekii Mn_MB_F_20050700_S1]TRU91474.1 MAG: methyltransferase domain-containing protein [Microcystis novacekii Mn_MB_F_20050700_S1D]
MKLLNFGCGSTFHPAWVNIDIASSSPEVREYDIRKNLPYPDAEFDACYSSHVLEHLKQKETQKLLVECYRVLKPKGIIRIVVPDLESIVRDYLNVLEQVDSGIKEAEPNYDWMMLELYDQTVRSFGGGEMVNFLIDPNIPNKDFVRYRIGAEAEKFWEIQADQKSLRERIMAKSPAWFLRKLRIVIAKYLVALVAGNEAKKSFEEGMFRNSGEIHRWMYDRYSLKRLLEQMGFTDVRVCRADESRIPDFNSYGLDMIESKIRKPDSLFMEAMKP